MLLVRTMPLDTVEHARDALQYAIQLEHATIPPYLTALYSLKPGTNRAIAELIKGIVFQGMQHMTLAANMLNAIGGEPDTDSKRFVHVERERLQRHLEFPTVAVENVFMRIEEPDQPIAFPAGTRMSGLAQQQVRTIGDFYRALRAALKAEWFTGDHARQVTGIVDPVYALADAQKTIDTIVEQGEGMTPPPLGGPGAQLAHCHRFAEIFRHRTVVPNPTAPQGYSYSGAPIRFDPAGVWPIVANPHSGLYPPASIQRVESDGFNRIYSNLLRALHTAFNGHPGYFDTAIGLMFDLKLQALKLMSLPIGANTHAAPCYEYVAG